MGFLDETGLAYFWSKIKTYISNNTLSKSGGTMTGNLTMSMGGKVDGFARSLYGIDDGFDKTDLNNLKTPGSYTFTNSEITAAANSDSRMTSGILHVMNNSAALDDSGYKIQIYMTISSNKWYTRRYNSDGSGSWSSWKQIATLEDSDAKYFPLSGGTLTGNITMTEGTQLLGNAESATRPLYQSIIRSAESPPNLNDYVYNGFYYVSGASGGGLTNEPVTGAAALYHVFALPTGTTQVVQRCYIMAGLENQIYQRRKNGGAWSQWTKVLTGEDDVATKDYVDSKTGGYIEIEDSGTVNLNTYTTEGKYYNPLPLANAELVNFPSDTSLSLSFSETSFMLEVLAPPGDYRMQILRDFRNRKTFYRTKSSSSFWTAWYSYADNVAS